MLCFIQQALRYHALHLCVYLEQQLDFKTVSGLPSVVAAVLERALAPKYMI